MYTSKRNTCPFEKQRRLKTNVQTRHLATTALLAGMISTPVSAHIIPVDFGSFSGESIVAPVLKNSGVSGNYGWIDGADVDWGDTHKTATFTFSLSSMADVTLKFEKKTNAFGGTGLIPGFSLFQGVPHNGSDHDFSVGSTLLRATDCAATPGCTATEGSLRSLTSFRITEDADPTGTAASVFTYVGSAYDGSRTLPAANSPLQDNNAFLVPGGDGVQDGIVSLLFPHLQAGSYIAFVGGADYGSQTNSASRGIGGTFSLTPSAVPVPGALWLFGSGLAGFAGLIRRKQTNNSQLEQ